MLEAKFRIRKSFSMNNPGFQVVNLLPHQFAPNLFLGVFYKTIGEVVCQRIYGALPLSYGAVICIKVAPVGFEPTTSGS